MKIQPADVKRVIADEDDFGHEMRVGHIFESLVYPDQFNTTFVEAPQHGGTYTDAITGKPRQFDYRCKILADGTHRTTIGKCALLAVECKNLHPSSPLVLCGRPRTSAEAYHTFIASNYDPMGMPNTPHMRRADGTLSLFPPDEFVGKSLLRMRFANGQLKTDVQPDIYDRWSQALASAVEMASDARFFAPQYKTRDYFSLVLPIVVVPDGTLWAAEYNSDGTISKDPVQVDTCEFFVEREIGLVPTFKFTITHIQFMTLKGFADLLSSFLSGRRKWDRVFPAGSVQVKI
jgi:hypothetical protein